MSEKLHPSRFNTLALALVSAAFVAVGVHAIWNGGGGRDSWEMYATTGFFALCLIVFLLQLLPGSSSLQVDAEGFTVRSLFRSWSYRWADVESFAVVRAGGRKMVGFRFSTTYSGPRALSKASRWLAGCDGALPDSFGHRPEDLARLLNGYLQNPPRS